MALALPHSFADGPGNTASGVQVTENDAGLRDAINGNASVWRTRILLGARLAPSSASSIGLVLRPDVMNDPFGAGAAWANLAFRIDPADVSVSGFSPRLRIRGTVFTNAVATISTHQIHLGAVTAWGGASGAAPVITTLGGVVTSTPALSSSAANSQPTATSPEVAFPTAGWYALWVNTGAINAGAIYMVLAELQWRLV